VLTASGDRSARLWDGRTGEALSPSLPAMDLSRSAAFLVGGRLVAWTGAGVMVDEVTADDRTPSTIRTAIEAAAGRTLSSTGTETTLSSDEILARFARPAASDTAAADAHFLRADARTAWLLEDYPAVVDRLEALRSRAELSWLDVRRLAGAYAVIGRWPAAREELLRHRRHWSAVPELTYMEAVVLSHLGDVSALGRHCADVIALTRDTQHPERAYWAARACLLLPRLDQAVAEAVEIRIDRANAAVPGELDQAAMRAAALLRTGRGREAAAAFRDRASQEAARLAAMWQALAHAESGEVAAARQLLARLEASPARIGPLAAAWSEAEVALLRRAIVARLGR
jgi:hypothetical protein